MNKLTAKYISDDLTCMLAGNFSGELHSIFDSAMNILCDGRLLTILAPRRCVHPRSTVLHASPVFSVLPIETQMRVAMKGGMLYIGTSETAVVSVSFADACAVDLSIDSLTNLRPPQNTMQRAAVVAQTLTQQENAEESLAALLSTFFPDQAFPFAANVYCRFLSERVDRFYDALQTFHTQECARLAGELAGCGAGLTPSSDDFLTGVFAAIYGNTVTGQIERKQAVQMCEAIAETAAPRTNIISAGFLHSSAAGLFNEDVLTFMGQFFSDQSLERLCHAACMVATFGSTSGMDILTGFCFGVAAMESVIERNQTDSAQQQPNKI